MHPFQQHWPPDQATNLRSRLISPAKKSEKGEISGLMPFTGTATDHRRFQSPLQKMRDSRVLCSRRCQRYKAATMYAPRYRQFPLSCHHQAQHPSDLPSTEVPLPLGYHCSSWSPTHYWESEPKLLSHRRSSRCRLKAAPVRKSYGPVAKSAPKERLNAAPRGWYLT